MVFVYVGTNAVFSASAGQSRPCSTRQVYFPRNLHPFIFYLRLVFVLRTGGQHNFGIRGQLQAPFWFNRRFVLAHVAEVSGGSQ